MICHYCKRKVNFGKSFHAHCQRKAAQKTRNRKGEIQEPKTAAQEAEYSRLIELRKARLGEVPFIRSRTPEDQSGDAEMVLRATCPESWWG